MTLKSFRTQKSSIPPDLTRHP
ncbi:unnamed protein product [Linum tenue]|uniref:Uncharacterized protein n=1 Tax=Linum tenue TaxID=586396 RepID=A0AAV0RYK2_9ROSI|nr:unnamed protein product [Linum tenue]